MSRQSELAALGRVADTGALSNRNLIINGAMQVHQRGGSVTGASGFNVDRWKQERGTLEGAMSQGTVASSTDPYVKGFRKTLKVTTSNTSTAGTHYYQAVHYFEGQNINRSGWDYLGSGSLILSFWVKASVAGTYGFFLEDDGTPKRIAGSYTLAADTWKYVTKVIPASSSLTIPDDNTRGMRIVFGISYGSDYVSASGAEEDAWDDFDNTAYFNQDHSLSSTSGSTWEITGVQLEVGDTATEFEHRSYGDELARCQRYYQEIDARFRQSSCIGYRKNSNHIYPTGGQNYTLPVEMRASPTFLNTGMSVTFTSLLNDNWVSTNYANLGSYTSGHSFGTNSRVVWYDSTVPGNSPFPADTPINITFGEAFKLDAEL